MTLQENKREQDTCHTETLLFDHPLFAISITAASDRHISRRNACKRERACGIRVLGSETALT